MRTSNFRGVVSAVVWPALWFCAWNLLATALAAQCTNVSQVPNQTISSGTSCYSNNDTLTAAGVTINGSASVTFVGGHTVHLAPGFHATAGTAGTTFHAWVETVPSVVSVSPASGSGLSQQFTWTASSPSGNANLAQLFALFNTSISGANGCYIYYSRGANALYLRDNSDTVWTGGFAPGSAGAAGNSNCTIYGTGSSVTSAGNQLAVTVNVTFQSAFAGTKNNYLNAYDNEGLYTGWQQMGTWTVPAPPQYYLTTGVSPAGVGSTTPWCPSGCLYASGSQVQITANPPAGYQFSSFSGSVNSASNPLIITMGGPMTVVANFVVASPRVPIGLVSPVNFAMVGSGSTATLSWHVSTGATYYDIYVGLVSQSLTQVGHVAAPAT